MPMNRRGLIGASSAFIALSCQGASSAHASTPMTVYNNGLKDGWSDRSWADVTLNAEYENAHPIKVEGDAWTALSLHHEPFTSAAYNQLVFDINGGLNRGLKLEIMITINTKPVKAGYIIQPTFKTWGTVSVPLAEIDGANTMIDGFCIQGQGEGFDAFYVNYVQFE